MNNIKNILTNELNLDEYMTDSSIDLAESASYIKTLSNGQIMQRDNLECSGVPFVLSGKLRLFRTSVNGREMNIYRVNKGDMCMLAALCVLTNKPYDFTVAAEGDTKLLVINSSVFISLVEDNSKFNKHVLSQLADKLIHTFTLHETIHLTSIEEKLIDYLNNNAVDGILTTTHNQIAQDLGTSRVVISRALSQLRDAGTVKTGRNMIELL